MTRFLAAAGCDARLQARNGFYAATAFVLAIMAGIALLLRGQRLELGWLIPAAALNNLMITAFYYIAALVLLEKAEGTLCARSVTPLRPGEYLWAKVATLTLLALLHNLVLAVLMRGMNFSALPLMVGLAQATAIMTLLGFAAVARYQSINTYLFPSLIVAGALMFPLVPYTLGWEHPLLYLHPLQAPLELMRAAIEPVPVWRVLYGLGYGALWVAAAFAIARHNWERICD